MLFLCKLIGSFCLFGFFFVFFFTEMVFYLGKVDFYSILMYFLSNIPDYHSK